MRLFIFSLFFKRHHAEPVQLAPVQQVRVIPLPCPHHGATLIPEQGEKPGEFHFVCPLCRLASQPVQKPIRQVHFPRPGKRLPGSAMHTERAVKRVSARLGQPIPWTPPARPKPHTIQTVAEMPVVKFPDAG